MTRRLLIALTVAALVLAAAPFAGAAPGKSKPPKPLPPPEEPAAGTTCSRLLRDSFWFEDSSTKDDDFHFRLTYDEREACFDVVSDMSGRWLITISRPDESRVIRSLRVEVMDAAQPGDSCAGFGASNEGAIYGTWTLPILADHRFDAIPATAVNGCAGGDNLADGGNGIGEYPEAIDSRDANGELVWETVWEPRPEHTHPFTLSIFAVLGLRKGSAIDVCIDLPPLSVELDEGVYPDPQPCAPGWTGNAGA